ncbi:MAG: hypothetical protein U0167_12865 [bacterium]
MSVEDFRINAFVRQVLSRFWVDLQALRYGVIGRVVYLQGRFEKVRPPEPSGSSVFRPPHRKWITENAALLETVEKEIRRESQVSEVVFHLENFRKVDGKWVSTGA